MAIRWQYEKPLWGDRVDWNALGMPEPIGEWWLNDGAGNRVQDASGNGNHGTLTNGPVWVPTTNGAGIALDGIDDYISAPMSDAGLLGACTLVWRGTLVGGSRYHTLFHKSVGEGAWNNPITWRTSNDVIPTMLALRATASAYQVWSGPPVVLNTSALYAAVFGAGVMDSAIFYTNGLGTTVPAPYGIVGSFTGTNAPLVIGQRANDLRLAGTMDLALAFPAALTAAQVAALQGPIPIWQPQRYWYGAAVIPTGGGSIFGSSIVIPY